MNCPLCHSPKSYIAKRSKMSDLRSEWGATFGFDPYPRSISSEYMDRRKCSLCHLEYFDPPCYGAGDFYARISKNAWYYEENKWEYDVAASVLAQLSPGNLLEIGCGNGHFLEKIASLGIAIEGVDINKDAVATCKTKGLDVAVGNVLEIEKTYDAVALFQVLEHMENAKELFEFLTTRLIHPGGHLIIAVPNPDGYLKDMDINLLDMPPHHNSCWGVKTFQYLQSQFGLQLIAHHQEPIRYVHYLGWVQNSMNGHARLIPETWKTNLVFKLQALATRLMGPLSYARDRERVVGQTHLVVMKNVR